MLINNLQSAFGNGFKTTQQWRCCIVSIQPHKPGEKPEPNIKDIKQKTTTNSGHFHVFKTQRLNRKGRLWNMAGFQLSNNTTV
jgi:hypothetical protein